jgi:phosphosulfolactate synthase
MINQEFNLSGLPDRTAKPRNKGMNMVMDKGLSLIETESLLSKASDSIDVVKLGFGTAVVSPNLFWRHLV